MTTPNDHTRSDDDLDRAIRDWLAPGPRTIPEAEVQRVVGAVRTTRQLPAWRAGPAWGRLVTLTRFAAASAAVVAIVAVASFAAGRTTPPPSGVASVPTSGLPAVTIEPTAAPTPAPAPMPVVTDTVLSGTVPATGAPWKVTYPQVGGLADAAVEATVDAALRGYAESTIRDFIDGDGATKPVDGQAPSELQISYTVAFRSPSLVSLRLLAYDFPSGAAHGGTALTTFTFDLTTGRQVALADLFMPGAAYLDALATEARDQLRSDPGIAATGVDPNWLTTGTAPTADDYAGWAVTAGGLEITFGQYQVAPYAAGMPAVTIPFARLAGLLDANGPVGSLIAAPRPEVTVTLGLYSGRPDPTWTLTDVQVARVMNLVGSLPTTTGTPQQGGLGYHGFTFTVRQAGQPDATYTAYAGSVVSDGGAPGTYLDDGGRMVESELLASGGAHLTAAEIALVQAALTPR